MNKKQWKEERRKWRLVDMSAFPHKRIKDKEDYKIVRDTLFNAIYDIIPKWYYDQCKSSLRYVYKYSDNKLAGRLNVKYAPNSYPHPTRNP